MAISTRHFDIVVVGNVNTDYIGRGQALPMPGQAVTGDWLTVGPGGKGANQALAAARLGARVALVAAVGDDERGGAALVALRAGHVDISAVERYPGMETGAVVIHVDATGQKQALSIPNANASLDPAHVSRQVEAVRARVLLIQMSVSHEVVMAALGAAASVGTAVFVDPARPGSIPRQVLRQSAVIKPNAREAESLTGIAITGADNARAAARALLAQGVGLVAVEAADEGNLLVWPDGDCLIPLLPVDSVDATGAGDAFLAALAVAFVEGRGWTEAGRFANASAALATTGHGAQPALPYRGAVDALLARQNV